MTPRPIIENWTVIGKAIFKCSVIYFKSKEKSFFLNRSIGYFINIYPKHKNAEIN